MDQPLSHHRAARGWMEDMNSIDTPGHRAECCSSGFLDVLQVCSADKICFEPTSQPCLVGGCYLGVPSRSTYFSLGAPQAPADARIVNLNAESRDSLHFRLTSPMQTYPLVDNFR